MNVEPDKLLKLAYCIFLFSMMYFFCVTFIPIPATGEDNAKYIVGFLVGTGVGSIITAYFRKNSPSEGLPPEDVAAIDAAKVKAIAAIDPPVEKK